MAVLAEEILTEHVVGLVARRAFEDETANVAVDGRRVLVTADRAPGAELGMLFAEEMRLEVGEFSCGDD